MDGDALLAAGKVTVGLASHWPCVTDNSGIITYGLMALGRVMSTRLNSSRSMAHLTFTFYLTVRLLPWEMQKVIFQHSSTVLC